MYSIMPIMSFVMAINGPVAMAGSIFSFSSVNAMRDPSSSFPLCFFSSLCPNLSDKQWSYSFQ